MHVVAMTSASSAEVWRERVRLWCESGQSAEAFAEGKSYSGSTLLRWSSRLGLVRSSGRIVQLVPKMTLPAAAEPTGPVATAEVATEVVIEVGASRIRVGHGFDRELLSAVVSVLGERR